MRRLPEEVRKMTDVEVGQANFGHFIVLQQIIRASGALQPRSENQHSHLSTPLVFRIANGNLPGTCNQRHPGRSRCSISLS